MRRPGVSPPAPPQLPREHPGSGRIKLSTPIGLSYWLMRDLNEVVQSLGLDEGEVIMKRGMHF